MSAAVRSALAEAASSVAGVSVSPYFQQTVSPGRGAVRKDRVDYPNPFGGVVRWQVVIFLPADQALAEKYVDEVVPEVVTAVREELVVTSVSQQQLGLPDGQLVNTVLIEGHREE